MDNSIPSFENLTERQKRVLVRIIEEGHSISETLRLEGLSRQVYYVWRGSNQNGFADCLEWLTQNAFRDILLKPLHQGMEKSFVYLQDVISNQNESTPNRLKAAQLLLTHGQAIAVAGAMDDRIQRIEAQLNGDISPAIDTQAKQLGGGNDETV